VLIVDDNRDTVAALSLGLKQLGHHTRAAFDGLEALEAAIEFRPQAAIIDLKLPVLDGWALAQRLRANPVFRRPKLIALTGLMGTVHIARSIAAGFDHHLLKPAGLPAIRAALCGSVEPISYA
jgi:CheY-like chemotaxis protein